MFQQSDKDEQYEKSITETNKAYRVSLKEDGSETTSDDSIEENDQNTRYYLEELEEYSGN